MNNKKTLIASIIGVAMLVVLVVSATFAYFTTAVSNDDGETLVTGKTDAIGSISLTNPTSNLHITLNALDMAHDNLGTYWATNDATLNYDSEEVQRDIAVATLTGGETTTYYECSTTINVSVSGTMVAGLQTGDAYIQFGGLLTDKVDLKNVSNTGYPVTFALNGTDTLSDKVSVSLAIENRNANQNSIAGKELTVTFSNDDLVCSVVEESVAFAIYSETDNSLRFYKNTDEVNVGDTYRNLKVTVKYTDFENALKPNFSWSSDYAEFVDKVIIEEKISPKSKSIRGMFAGFNSATILDLTKLDVSNVTDMTGMFELVGSYNQQVSIIGIESWDTSKVTSMHGMFRDAAYVPDISGWNTSNVIDMSYMFYRANNIPDISGWNVSNVTNMDGMFSHVSNIPDISGWDTSNVIDMSYMFERASDIPDISGWNVSNVTNMTWMFDSVSNIPDISEWDVSNVTDMSYMFYCATTGYTAENPLDLSNWNVSNVTASTHFINSIKPTGSIIAPNFN